MTEKEMKARIAELENTIDRLKATIIALEDRFKAAIVALEDKLEDAEAETAQLVERSAELEQELEDAKENVDPNKVYADWKESNLD